MENSEVITIDECESAVRKYLNTDDLKVTNFAVVHQKSDNFLIKISAHHNSEDKVFNFFGKPATKENPALFNEILFKNFKKTIPTFDRRIAPQVYHHGNSSLLLFEDLFSQGFRASKVEASGLNLDHLPVALDVLAKFHASSLAYENINPKREFTLEDEFELVGLNWNKEQELKAVSHLLNEDARRQIPVFLNELRKRQSMKFKKTLCHGNLKLENVMFKYEDGKPIACRFINFKAKLYAPPVYDVLQLVFLSSTSYLRQHSLDFLLRYYFNSLKNELEKNSIDIDNILKFDDILLSAHYILPLIKLEVVQKFPRNDNAIKELEEITIFPRLTREDCYAIVKNKTGKANYQFLWFQVIPVDETNGFLGDYYRLIIKVTCDNDVEKTMKCFVKCNPKSKMSQGVLQETGAFSKELFVYKTLLPLLHKHGINIINECVPECYLQRTDDLIVFEDLVSQNYKMQSSQKPFNFQTLKVVFQKLAKFHAAMLILEEKMSEKLGRVYSLTDDYSEYISEIFFLKEETHLGAKLMQAGVKGLLNILDSFPDLKASKSGQKLLGNYSKITDRFYEVIKPSKHLKNTLNHGDLWINNIMIKEDDHGNTVDCCFLDYQVIRYCPPGQDFLSIAHITTDRATRLTHEKEFQGIYLTEMASVLSAYNYSIFKLFPYEDFIESLKLMRIQIVMQTTMYHTFVINTSEDNAALLDDDDIAQKVFFEDRKEYIEQLLAKSPIIKNRMRENIVDVLEEVEQLDFL